MKRTSFPYIERFVRLLIALGLLLSSAGAATVRAAPSVEREHSAFHKTAIKRILGAVINPPVGQTWRVYYHANGQPIAMRETSNQGASNTLTFLHQDHLGSTSLTTNSSGAVVNRQTYYPYGELRWGTGTAPTTIGYTGQRRDTGVGSLMFYKARYYSPLLSRFVSVDTIVPEPGNPQALNRYSYVHNNPIRYTDSSGHCVDGITTVPCLVFFTFLAAFFGGAAHYQYNVAGHSWWESPYYASETFKAGGDAAALALTADLAILTLGSSLCADGDCSNEATAAAQAAKPVTQPVAQPVMNLSQQMIDNLANASTKNPNSNEVVLGLYRNGQGYTAMAQTRGATYLDMSADLWRVFRNYPADFIQVNMKFLQNAIDKGKIFTLETPFKDAILRTDTNLYLEIQYLLNHGYKLVTTNGVGQLVPK